MIQRTIVSVHWIKVECGRLRTEEDLSGALRVGLLVPPSSWQKKHSGSDGGGREEMGTKESLSLAERKTK